MTVTIEKNTPALTDKSVTIEGDERYAVEAGSYLAYKPNGSQKVLGETVVARPGDKTETEKLTFDPNNTVIPGTENGQYTDFVPDVEGLYVFRRVINVAADGTEDFKTDGDYNATDVTKTGADAIVGYDAYYFVPEKAESTPGAGDGVTAKYYKVSNLSVVPDNTPDKADDNLRTDGLLLYASAGFVEEEEKVLDPMDLKCVTYDAAAATAAGAPGAGKYLVAAYDTGDSNYETKFKVAADLYDKSIHQFEYATALKAAALAEQTAAQGASGSSGAAGTGYQGEKDAYDDAKTTLEGKTTALKTAKKNYEEALVARDNAKEANDEAQRNYEQSMAKLYGTGHETDGSESVYTTGDGSLYGKYQTSLGQYNTANTAAHGSDTATFINELKAFNTAESKGMDFTGVTTQANLEAMPLTVEFLEEFKTWLAGQPSDELHDYYAKYAQMLIDKKNYDNEKAACLGTGGYKEVYLGTDGTGNSNGTKKTLADKETDLTTKKNAYLGADGTGTTAGAVYEFNQAVEDYNIVNEL